MGPGGRPRKLSWSLNSSHYVFKNLYLTVHILNSSHYVFKNLYLTVHICNYYGMNLINIFVFDIYVFTSTLLDAVTDEMSHVAPVLLASASKIAVKEVETPLNKPVASLATSEIAETKDSQIINSG